MRSVRVDADHRYVADTGTRSVELEFRSVPAARRAQMVALEAGYAAVLVGERRVEVFVGTGADIEAIRRRMFGDVGERPRGAARLRLVPE
jgi:hypothetical protein